MTSFALPWDHSDPWKYLAYHFASFEGAPSHYFISPIRSTDILIPVPQNPYVLVPVHVPKNELRSKAKAPLAPVIHRNK